MATSSYSLVGILGGTFDPIHYGHLRAAWEVSQSLQLKELRFIPLNQPVHRPAPVASITHRVAMLELAIKNIPSFKIDKREIDRGGPSYTFDTLTSLRKELPQTALCWLIGMDAFSQITTWHRWEELINLAHFIVLQRPGAQMPNSGQVGGLLSHQIFDKTPLSRATHGCIWFEPITLLDISSTAIREQLAIQQEPYFLLPNSVLQYNKEHKIYT